MPRLRLLKTAAEARMLEHLNHTAGLSAYRHGEVYEGIDVSKDLHESRLDLPEGLPPLTMTTTGGVSRPQTDTDNAILLYRALSGLKSTHATDRRLWAALCHTDYWSYTRWRFPISDDDKKAIQHIRTHWFVSGGGLGALRRNAVSRLWWAAQLTVAPWERDSGLSALSKPDRFYYTRVLLSSQEVYLGIMERDFGSNLRLRICLLDAFWRFRQAVSSADQLIRRACSRLNLILGYRHLPVLPVEEIANACDRVVQAAAAELSRGE